MPPPLLSRLPPEPTASTVPFRRSRGRGCTVRKEDEEEARNAAAAAAAGRPAPRGRCPRGCSQALRGALGRGRRRLSSPSPEPGLASQRPNSQTSIMAAASERRELSAAASRLRTGILPQCTKSPATSPPASLPAPSAAALGAGAPGSPRGGGRRAGPRQGRDAQGRAGVLGRGQKRQLWCERRVPNLLAPLSMPSMTARGSLGLVPRPPPEAALAAAASAATQGGGTS